MAEIQEVFTLLSIKTRIETPDQWEEFLQCKLFLLYYPLKQGLKPLTVIIRNKLKHGFYSTIH